MKLHTRTTQDEERKELFKEVKMEDVSGKEVTVLSSIGIFELPQVEQDIIIIEQEIERLLQRKNELLLIKSKLK